MREFNSKILKYLDNYDRQISDKIHNLELDDLEEKIVYLFARLFNPDFIISYLFAILLFKYFLNDDFYFIIKPVTHTIICLILTLVLKKVTGRPRPILKEKIMRQFNLRKHENNCSMPSGDSLQSANFSIILLCYFNSYFGFGLLPFVMFSRVFYFCHYILDTVVGAFLGLVISYTIYLNIN